MVKKKFTDEELKELHSKGLNDVKIAEKLGVARSGVCYRRKKLGLEPQGQRGREKKFTDEKLRELHSKGLNDPEMAEKLDVTAGTITQRRNKLGLDPNGRKSWSDEEVKRRMRELKEEMGRSPRCSDDYRLAGAVQSRFGSWNELKKELGMKITGTGPKEAVSDEEVIDFVREEGVVASGETAEEFDATSTTIQNKFRRLAREGKLNRVSINFGNTRGSTKWTMSKLFNNKYLSNKWIYWTDKISEVELAKNFEQKVMKIDLSEVDDFGLKHSLSNRLRNILPEKASRYLRSKFLSSVEWKEKPEEEEKKEEEGEEVEQREGEEEKTAPSEIVGDRTEWSSDFLKKFGKAIIDLDVSSEEELESLLELMREAKSERKTTEE